MKLIYPAIFTPYEDNVNGYAVEFPDLPGCITGGDTLEEALGMAEDAASGWVLTELEEGLTPPKASHIKDIAVESDEFVSMVRLDIDTYAEKYGNKAIKKTLTITAWMNTYAEKNNISCSKLLQEAINNIIKSA